MTVSIGSSGVAAPGKNCDAITHVQRLFGFEDVSLWRSTVAGLSSVPNPRTEGCFALGVTGSGYMPIEGSRFPASAANKPSKMSVDLFIPTGQPNPSWLGALQSYLECPSANLFNAYIGQVELTGRPVGAYSTLTFNLPANVKSTLAGSFNDCSIKFALNVNQTGKAWTLDKLKFIK